MNTRESCVQSPSINRGRVTGLIFFLLNHPRLILHPASDPSLCYPAKNRSHISIVCSECQRPSSSGHGGTAAAQITAPSLLSDAVADVILAHRLCSTKHLCSWTPVNVCVHAFLNTFKTFRYQHTLSPHRDTPNTFFFLFCYLFSSEMIQEGSKSICLTFVHNIWPLVYSAEQLINNATSTHVFPFTTRSEGTHHPACYYPALPQQWVHSLLVPLGERAAFWA